MTERRSVWVLVGLAMVLATSACIPGWIPPVEQAPGPDRVHPGARIHREVVGGLDRHWQLHVPGGYGDGESMGLLVALHGGGGSHTQLAKVGLDDLSERERVLVAVPNAWEGYWNDGRRDPKAVSVRRGVDDVAFIRRVIEATSAEYQVDPTRVYVAGYSNGAMMSARVACDLSHVVAAVGMVAGSLGKKASKRCEPAHPVSMVNISGPSDRVVPFEGGHISVRGRSRGHVIGVPKTASIWGRLHDCAVAAEQAAEDGDPNQNPKVSVQRWSGCRGETEIEVHAVAGVGHTWPINSARSSRGSDSSTPIGFDATETLWRFFEDHPRFPPLAE